MTGEWRTLSVAVDAQIAGYLSAMNRGAAATQQFARDIGILRGEPAYEQVVAAQVQSEAAKPQVG